MIRNRHYTIFFTMFCCYFSFAQTIQIAGTIKSDVNVENIHVINKTSQKFTITDKYGKFKIPASLNDTISFSSVQHKPKELIISKEILDRKTVLVLLEEAINTLDQVTIGKVLSGDLMSDIKNVDGKPPVNFYDLDIPGYTGKLATQSERRLYEATTGAGIIPLNPIINAITGRTKRLKEHIQHEKNDVLLNKIRVNLSESLFSLEPLEKRYRTEFFYFCESDESFYSKCSGKKDLEVLDFLQKKLKQYKTNLKEAKD